MLSKLLEQGMYALAIMCALVIMYIPTALGSATHDVISTTHEDIAKLTVSRKDLTALAVVLYCEARGESWYGIAAVADVVRNRVKSDMFPNTYYDVVTQRKQFSCVKNSSNLLSNVIVNDTAELIMFEKITKLARRVIVGDMGRMTANALFYHTTNTRPYWASHYDMLGDVGNHRFYTANKL